MEPAREAVVSGGSGILMLIIILFYRAGLGRDVSLAVMNNAAERAGGSPEFNNNCKTDFIRARRIETGKAANYSRGLVVQYFHRKTRTDNRVPVRLKRAFSYRLGPTRK